MRQYNLYHVDRSAFPGAPARPQRGIKIVSRYHFNGPRPRTGPAEIQELLRIIKYVVNTGSTTFLRVTKEEIVLNNG